MVRQEKLFLTENTLPLFERLLDILDAIPGEVRSRGASPCEEIFLAREREYQDSYRHIPALDELAARYGDPGNRRVYMMSRDVEGGWLDLHRRETAPLRRSIDLAQPGKIGLRQ